MNREYEIEGFMQCKNLSTVIKRLESKIPKKYYEYLTSYDMDYIKKNKNIYDLVRNDYKIEFEYEEITNEWYYNLIIWGN